MWKTIGQECLSRKNNDGEEEEDGDSLEDDDDKKIIWKFEHDTFGTEFQADITRTIGLE